MTRSGTVAPATCIELDGPDALWHRAAGRAGDEIGTHVPFVVVTRQGWASPEAGTQRTWRRLRERR